MFNTKSFKFASGASTRLQRVHSFYSLFDTQIFNFGKHTFKHFTRGSTKNT